MTILAYISLMYNVIENARLFASLRSLNLLDLSINKLTWLPDKVFASLSNLKELYLNETVFVDMRKLNKFALNQDRLTNMPKGNLSGLSKLTKLDLYNNYISLLDEFCSKSLTNLQRLDLKFISLTHLPARKFANVKIIVLRFDIKSVEFNFGQSKLFSAISLA